MCTATRSSILDPLTVYNAQVYYSISWTKWLVPMCALFRGSTVLWNPKIKATIFSHYRLFYGHFRLFISNIYFSFVLVCDKFGALLNLESSSS